MALQETGRKNRSSANRSLGGSLNNWGDLDSRLLNSEKGDKQSGQSGGSSVRSNSGAHDLDRAGSLRRQALKAKIEQKKQQLKEKVKELNPIYQASKQALRASWTYLIPSFGLTLIYINIHAFFRLIFPSFFCNLGEEWTLPALEQAAGAGQGGVLDIAKKFRGQSEWMGLFLLDIIFIFIIIGIAYLIAVMLNVVENPVDALSALSEWVWDKVSIIFKDS